jgi:hypothetical protein
MYRNQQPVFLIEDLDPDTTCTGFRYKFFMVSARTRCHLYGVLIQIYYSLGWIRMLQLLPLQGTGMNKFIYRIQVQINYGFGWIRLLPLQATGTNKLQIWPELSPTCTGFRYEFITD